MTNQDLVKQFRETTEQLTQLIGQFDSSSFNRKPANDGWSAGEVIEHLLIFDIRLNQILEDATHETTRDINEQVTVFTPKVTNRKNKIDAPPFLIPTPGIKSKDLLVEQLRAERKKIFQSIEEKDLSLVSKQFPHRFYGEMTVYEWLNLIDLHTKRHMEQLGELLNS